MRGMRTLASAMKSAASIFFLQRKVARSSRSMICRRTIRWRFEIAAMDRGHQRPRRAYSLDRHRPLFPRGNRCAGHAMASRPSSSEKERSYECSLAGKRER
jgi:hypothetical protein